MLEKVPHYSPLYRDFRSIDPTDKQRIIRVYEEKEKAIGQLDPMEYFELTVLYVDALFATGAHRKHLLMVDLVIFTSIDQNIQFLHGEDVYQRMLFRKAASAFRIQDYQSSEHITRELIKMYPGQALYTRLLTANLFRQEKSLLQFGRAAAIFCILAAALVIVLDLLVIENFYPLEHHAMVWLRNDVFLLGVLIFVGCYGFAYYRSWQTTRQFSQQHKNKKPL